MAATTRARRLAGTGGLIADRGQTATGSPLTSPPASPRRLARIAGVLYLTVGVLAAWAHLVVRPTVQVAGDAAATAAAVAANESLLRAAFTGDLVHLVSYALLAMTLFMLLKHVNWYAAAAMMTFVAIAVAIMSVNMINHMAAVELATDASYATALGADGAAALVVMFLQFHEVGFVIAEVFFGLWLLPLGYLAYRSGYFPRALGVLLAVGCFSYLALALTVPLFDGLAQPLADALALPPSIAEVWMVGYLLVRGVKVSRPDDRAAVAA
ncbi:MAG: DUF4386 domain-containing protein [Actinomycetota bacterium]|nr:DUF4386 domain-containing protein [Actinomycetota bacterium]